MSRLEKIYHDTLDTRGTNLYLTLSTYNFSFWFNGRRGVVVLDEYVPVVAFVNTDGSFEIHSAKRDVPIGEYVDRLKRMLGINEDLGEFYNLSKNDPILMPFGRELVGWKPRSTSLWWGLVIGVCQQNASFRQGWRSLYNIMRFYGRRYETIHGKIVLPPTPEDILTKPMLLRETGVGYRADTIVNIARWITRNKGIVEKLERLPSKDVERILKGIKGVGSYTARLSIILAYRKYDLPPIDRWLKRLIVEAYGVSEHEAEKYWIKRWGKWSGLAAYASTISLDAEVLSIALKKLREGRIKPTMEGKMTPLSLWKYL